MENEMKEQNHQLVLFQLKLESFFGILCDIETSNNVLTDMLLAKQSTNGKLSEMWLAVNQ